MSASPVTASAVAFGGLPALARAGDGDHAAIVDRLLGELWLDERLRLMSGDLDF